MVDTPQHWLVEVARRAGLPDADRLDVPAKTPIREAWAAVARVCRVGEPELAAVVATRFRLNVARLDAAEPRSLKLVPESVARRFASPFLTLDVARDDEGGWIVVESGDGGVSGLPLSLLEVGCSAGLNLMFDRYWFDYSNGTTSGDFRSPVRVNTVARGSAFRNCAARRRAPSYAASASCASP